MKYYRRVRQIAKNNVLQMLKLNVTTLPDRSICCPASWGTETICGPAAANLKGRDATSPHFTQIRGSG